MAAQNKDFYRILGVDEKASQDDIKKAYRKLAIKWHPDRHPGDDRAAAEEKFKRINEAKEVLTDPDKRAKYDRFGQSWQHGQDFTPPGGGGWQTMNPEDFESIFGGGGGFSDFFASMFGADMTGKVGGRRRSRQARGADVQAELHVGISDAMQGGRREFSLNTVQACGVCDGTGELGNHVCPACGGMGRVRGNKTVEVAIPKEMRDGLVLRLRGLGEAGEGGGQTGDLYLTLRLTNDSVYRREGDDVYADVPIAPWEALDGAKVDVRALDGTVTLTIPPGTKSGAKLRLRGLGLGRESGGRGDFYAVIRLALPDELSESQQELIRQLKDAGTGTVTGGARK